MKLSKREKYLLLVLLVVVILAVTYMFGIKALNNYKASVEAKHAEVLNKYNDATFAIESKAAYEKKLNELMIEVSGLSRGYLNTIDQEKIILFIEKHLKNNNIMVKSLNFTEETILSSKDDEKVVQNADTTQSTDTSSTSETANTTETTQVAPVSTVEIDKANILVSYEASYNDLMYFISDLQNGDIETSISNITASVADNSKLIGTISIDVFAIDNEFTKATDVMWEDVIECGKNNPFYSQSSIVEVAAMKNKNYDFIMTAKPTSSDIPTVVLQKLGKTTEETYIYADSNLIESINISFKVENDKYYYKYSSANNKYPLNDAWAEFQPTGSNSIGLVIYSCTRNDASDTSGVKINIDNQTPIDVKVDVIDDDVIRPRVSFENLKGVKINNDQL